jgi:hypothetical protein
MINLETIDTNTLLRVLKKRYHTEMAIQDYIEMIECEVLSLKKEQEIILQNALTEGY